MKSLLITRLLIMLAAALLATMGLLFPVTGQSPTLAQDETPTLTTVRSDAVQPSPDTIADMRPTAVQPDKVVNNVATELVVGGVGAIALLVAAIGIANTMAIAILERTREIGLMKAVGATNRHVLGIFLSESAGIGFLGGLGSIALGWSLGQVANVFALAYFAGQSVETGAPPPSVAVATPLWLPIFALIFATVIGLLSGIYPALSAATLPPVTALKYE